MRRLISVLLLALFSIEVFAAEKPQLLIFTADWCNPCNYMKEKIFVDSDVISFMSRFKVVLVDVDTFEGATLQSRYDDQKSIPYFVILDSKGKAISSKTGLMEKADFISFLEKSGQATGASETKINYFYIPDLTGFTKGWEFGPEAGLGGVWIANRDLTGSNAIKNSILGASVGFSTKYNASPKLSIRITPSFFARFQATDKDAMPKCAITLPADLDIHVSKPFYLFAGVLGSGCRCNII